MTTTETKDFALGSDSHNQSSGLTRLLARVRARPADLSAPAQSLSLEADGLLLAQNEVCPGCELHYSLPAETRSITLRDEAGVPRAHLLTSQLNTHVFDQGRLSLTLTLDAASGQWSLCVIDLS